MDAAKSSAPATPDKTGPFEGAMQDSQRFTASDRANQVVFVEALGKNERALMLTAVIVAVAMAAYALARVNGAVELQAQRGQQQATTYQLAQQQTAQVYTHETEQLARQYQAQAEQMRDQFKQLQQQARLTELILDDWNVTARRAGLRLKGDYAHGPQGNPDAESFRVQLPSQPQKKP